nr:unnamed protein product [Callosobruchus chinensis]
MQIWHHCDDNLEQINERVEEKNSRDGFGYMFVALIVALSDPEDDLSDPYATDEDDDYNPSEETDLSTEDESDLNDPKSSRAAVTHGTNINIHF